MEKITRTIKTYNALISNSKTGELLETRLYSKEPTKGKVAIDYIKKTGNTEILIEIVNIEEKREMSLEFFLANSTIVDTEIEENNNEEIL